MNTHKTVQAQDTIPMLPYGCVLLYLYLIFLIEVTTIRSSSDDLLEPAKHILTVMQIFGSDSYTIYTLVRASTIDPRSTKAPLL